MEFINELTIFSVLIIVVAAIILDAVLGVIKTFKPENENFDIRKLPQFLATGVLPYAGGLIVLGIVAEYIGQPYDTIFYPIVALVLAKYLAEIKDKMYNIFGI